MNQSAPLIYSTHARWYVSIPSAVDRRGHLRRALVIKSPHCDSPLFVELAELELADAIDRAASLVDSLFHCETWFRRPRQIRCDSAALTHKVAERLMDEVHVRTDRSARGFKLFEELFRAQVLAQGFAAATG